VAKASLKSQRIEFLRRFSPTRIIEMYLFIEKLVFMKNKLELKEYFDDKELIKILCKKRAIAAKKWHDVHFLYNISTEAKSPHTIIKKEIFSFFPPRSQWTRLPKKERELLQFNALKINSCQLEKTVWQEIKKCKRQGLEHPLWLQNLLTFTEGIRNLAFDKSRNYELPKPKIIPELKSGITYRPISIFELIDNILIGQISKYLSNCFDPLFSDSSYAFRTGIQKGKTFNHHKAVEDIIEFKKKIGKPLYVAECDIKKFFDCVNHQVITEEFQVIAKEAKEKLNIEIDKRAVHFFHSYLKAYSFIDNVKHKEQEILNRYKITNGTIPWVNEAELLEVGSKPATERIGVPQGGAISCLIANIMLNKTDRILNDNSDENTFYSRFCDDMILMHLSKARCEALLEKYQTSLRDLKLICHEAKGFKEYGKEFWDEGLKSKLPYRWAINYKTKAYSKKNVPWLSFVGYQIRYECTVRIRKKSIKNESLKQVSETDKVIKVVRKGIRPKRSCKAVRYRLQQRLIAMSVGRVYYGSTISSMCWTAGFNVLKKNTFVSNQIRRLDRNREKQIKRLERNMGIIETPIGKYRNSGDKPLKVYGYNYSYNKQF